MMTLQAAIREIRNLKIDLDVPLERSGNTLERNIVARYGKYPSDVSWAPLSPSTVAKKGKNTPLVDTGELKNAQRQYKAKGVREVGSNLDKDVWMEYGVRGNNGTMRVPARPVKQPEAKKAEEYFLSDVHNYLSSKL